MDTNPKKYNTLSVISFVLVLAGFLVSSRISSLAILSGIAILAGYVLAIVSFFQIRKTKEKGKGLLIAVLVTFLLMIVSVIVIF